MNGSALTALFHWDGVTTRMLVLVGFSLAILDFAGLRPAAERKLQAASVYVGSWARRQWSTWNVRTLPPHPNLFLRAVNAIGRGLFHTMPFVGIVLILHLLLNDIELDGIVDVIGLLLIIVLLLCLVMFAAISTLLAVANALLLITKFLKLTAKGPAGILGSIGMIVAVLSLVALFY